MKFSKLVKIITEAKGTKPGQRYFNVQNASSPAGISSSPVGKSGNVEKVAPKSKWEFNSVNDLDKKSSSGFSESSRLWKAMTNAFGLLANDTTFQTQVNEIANEFDKNRDSYGFSMGVDPKVGAVRPAKGSCSRDDKMGVQRRYCQ